MPSHRSPLKCAPTKRPRSTRPLEDAPLVSVALNSDADAFIDGEPQLRMAAEKISSDVDQFIEQAADLITKATRKQHIKALMFAYAIWLKMGRNPAYRRFVERQRTKRKRHNKQTTSLHLIVEVVVNYGDEDNDQRRLRSRDVAAINYLYYNNIGPFEAEDLATKPEEGLNSWSKRWPAIKKQVEAGKSLSSKTAESNIVVTIQLTDADGRRTLERFYLDHNDSTASYIRELEADLRDKGSRDRQSHTSASPVESAPATVSSLRGFFAEG